MRLSLLVVCLVVFVSKCVAVPLWGVAGHELTAGVAQVLLDSNSNSQTSNILSGATMASVANWADQIKTQPQWAWSYNLHFINTPDWSCNYKPSRDCIDEVCVGDAILNYTARLQTQTDTEQILEALKFLIHFVGDIHQPLHCGFSSDKGGNTITGTFNGYSDNLHQIWDKWVIEERIKDAFSGSQNDYLSYLNQQVAGAWAGQAQQWAQCANTSALSCPDEWGNESAGLACTYAYTDENGNHITDGFNLGSGYYNFVYPIIDQQLAKGGVRLAATLNKVFGSSYAAELLRSVLPSNRD